MPAGTKSQSPGAISWTSPGRARCGRPHVRRRGRRPCPGCASAVGSRCPLPPEREPGRPSSRRSPDRSPARKRGRPPRRSPRPPLPGARAARRRIRPRRRRRVVVRQHGRTPLFEGRQCRTCGSPRNFPAAGRCLDRCPGRGAQGGRDTADSRRRRVRSPVKRTGSGSEPGRAHLAVRAGAVVIGSALLPLMGLPAAASPAASSSCQALVVNRVGEPAASSVLVTLPTALLGQELRASNFTVSQRVEPVALHSVQRLAASRVDLAIVLDTAAAAPDPAVARARRFAASFWATCRLTFALRSCPEVRRPTVMSALSDPRARALLAVRQSRRTAGQGGLDGVALAGGLLATGSAGRGTSS